jgi:hypothetical protein
MQDELRTGDLACIDTDGLVRIVGRRSDFVKIMGIRIDLGMVERQLRVAGIRACVTAVKDQIQVTYESAEAPSPGRVCELRSEASGLGTSVISAQGVAALPRLSNGKVDRLACAATHRAEDRHQAGGPRSGTRQPADLAAVVAVLAPLLGDRAVDPDRSFAELGGDPFPTFRHPFGSVDSWVTCLLIGTIGRCESCPGWPSRPSAGCQASASRPTS